MGLTSVGVSAREGNGRKTAEEVSRADTGEREERWTVVEQYLAEGKLVQSADVYVTLSQILGVVMRELHSGFGPSRREDGLA